MNIIAKNCLLSKAKPDIALPAPMPILNIEGGNFLDRTEKLLGKDNKWEVHVAQQVALPRSTFPYPNDDHAGSLE